VIIITLFVTAGIIALFVLLVAILTNVKRIPRHEDLITHQKETLTQLTKENRVLREELDAKIDRLRDSTQEALHQFLNHTTTSLESIRTSNEKKLDEMRTVVNEKLEKTLEVRLRESFAAVSNQLENVHKGLGEMKNVAQSVGSLNRILSGSKSRGILGEVQLGQIIEDMLPPQLYEREYAVKKGAANRVEYAIRLPGVQSDSPVFLPIDSKFPLEPYERLLDGYDAADAVAIEAARKELYTRIRTFARDVKSKYVSPPETTPFAVIFLPTEGLYAEIARDAAFFEALRQDGIIFTGPTTFSAMLGSLQLGFKTLQIQKGAADIEKTLGAVKKEFANFESVLTKAQQKITQAGNDLETLVGTRSRAISRSLREVQVYTGEDALKLLGIGEDMIDD